MKAYAELLPNRVRSGVRCRPDDTARLRHLLATGFDVVAVEPCGLLRLELDRTVLA